MLIEKEQNHFEDKENHRTCLQCSYVGKMPIWIEDYTAPKVIAFLGLFFSFVPGLIFIACVWKKNICPSCGALQIDWRNPFVQGKDALFLMRLFAFLCVFLVGGFFVAVLGGYGCNGGAGGSVELREGYWPCFLMYLIPYCWVLWLTAKWAFKKRI